MPRGQVFRSEIVKTPAARALTAAAQNVSPGYTPGTRFGRTRRSANGWQNELWDLYDSVPEFRFAVAWVGNLLSKAKLEVRKDGEYATDQRALDALASLFGGPEGQSEMFRLLGIHFTVAGEAYIVGTPPTTGEHDDWRVVAATQVSYVGDTVSRIEDRAVREDELVRRLWKPHPRRFQDPDCPARAVLPILREILKLTMRIEAQTSSRLASAGLLIMPSEMELPSISLATDSPDSDSGEQTAISAQGADGLSQRLIRIASIAMEDQSSAAALVPLVITAPGEHIEKVQHLTFWSELDKQSKELRDENIRRIASGMDMPPEVLLGTADVNHWGAWQIEEAAIKAHTEPLLQVILASLTEGYLRPLLEELGVPDVDSYEFTADTSELRLRPNRSKEALELYDRAEVNGDTLRRENGFTESDVMDDAEKVEWFLKKVASGQTMPAQVVDALRQLGVPITPVAEPSDRTHEARPVRSLDQHPRRAEPDPDESEAEDAVVASASHHAATPNALVLATDQMVKRALERAGNRLKSKVGKVSLKARDIYLTLQLTGAEADALLQDAWDLEDFAYPGVDNAALERCLNEYTRTLLSLQKPHTREGLARHLLLGLAEVA